jgi:hypothetical protein
MRVLVASLAAALMLLGSSDGRGGVDHGVMGGPPIEVLVFEHPDSQSCRLFRRDVLPNYPRAIRTEAPLRFVDVGSDSTAEFALKAPIDVVPTAVVVRGGREVDRIVGYWGASNFFRMLSHILAGMEGQAG